MGVEKIAEIKVDPAHAGMILPHWICGYTLFCGPRACGDDPNLRTTLEALKKWTPRMRG